MHRTVAIDEITFKRLERARDRAAVAGAKPSISALVRGLCAAGLERLEAGQPIGDVRKARRRGQLRAVEPTEPTPPEAA